MHLRPSNPPRNERIVHRGATHRIRCYDNAGATLDRYAVVFMDREERRPGFFDSLAMNAEPFHGIGASAMAMPGSHLGRRVPFAALPEQCQRAVKARL